MSERHARRMLAGYREQGAAALAHGNRGRRPHNTIPATEAAAVVELATQRYQGANHTHFTELLQEREGITLSRPTVRRILTKAGIGSPRRQRMPQSGMLVQLDGSHHAWLEDRGPKFALLLAVDDATGTVVNAVFRTGEDTRGYFMLLEPDRELGSSPGAVQRSPCRFQAQRPSAGNRGGSHPVHSWPAGTGDPANLRPLTPGQGPGGAHGRDLSGPVGNRTAPG